MARSARTREREWARRQALKQDAASTGSRPPKSGSLVSQESLAKPEESTPVGMSGVDATGGIKSVSGGRHHGVVSNIADSVGYMLAEHARDNPNSTHTGTAYTSMDRAYQHLAMHHSSHLQGNYEAAASHLKQAGDAINYSMSRIGGSLKGGVQNAFGEKHRRADLEATVNHTVSHYASTHVVGGLAKLAVDKHELVDVSNTPTSRIRTGSADVGRDVNLGRVQTHSLGGQQLQRYHDMVQQRHERDGTTPQVSPADQKLASMMPKMTRRDHVLQAHSDLMNKGKMHPKQAAALSHSDIVQLHEITGVTLPRKYQKAAGTSMPSTQMTPMPRDREL